MNPLDRRLIVMQGKGGVGRSTLTAALGRAAARTGRSVCVVELYGQSALARTLGESEASYGPREISPRLHLMSLSPIACISDFGVRKLKVSALSRLLFESRLMTGFIEAVPGLQDLVQLGKIEDMIHHPLAGEPHFDLVILDAPATGHGLSLLSSARAMQQITRVGPFHDLAAIIEDLLSDHIQTASMLVTLPELLPVNESLDLIRQLAAEDAPPDAVLINQCRHALLPESPSLPTLLQGLHSADVPANVGRTLRDLAMRASEVATRQRIARHTLEEKLPEVADAPVELVNLPRLEPGPTIESHIQPLVDTFLSTWGEA